MKNESTKGVIMKIEDIKKASDLKKSHLNLIQYCLEHGYKISVHLYNDEEPELEKSDNYEKIKEFSECADMIDLCIYENDVKIGWALLVLYNDDEEIVSDYTNSKFLNNWANQYEKLCEAVA